MMKRGIAFILCLSMIISFIVPVAFVFADTEVLSVEYDGSRIEDISISHDEKKVLSAVMGNYSPENCQWQILVDSENGIWADIYDKTTAECEISYALVKNVMESSGEAFIRCKVMGEKGWVYSNSVSVSVYFKEAEEIPVEDPGLVLIFDMEVLPPEEPVEEIPDEESEEISPEEPVEEVPGEEISGTFSVGEAARTLLADGDGGEEIKEYVNVTIHYLDAQSLKVGADQSIYKPYTARIEVGSDFIQTVLSPTYLGFAPYTNLQYSVVDGKDVYSGGEDATVIHFNETNVQEDIVKKVYYKPIEVPYGIRYMFQNINDDLYTERPDLYRLESAETGTIIKDEMINLDEKDTVGFTKMYHIPDSVAADGSTVFEVYYDRNYYLIQFDFDGGYGSDPIYAKFGTPFVVNDPVRHGYNFVGWDLLTIDTDSDGEPDSGDGVADVMPSTIPAENRKYRAIWETVDTTYTVVYWKENANDNGYSYWGYETFGAKSGTTVSASDNIPQKVYNDERDYFEFNSVLSDKDVLVEGNGTTIVNAYYTRNYYTITFKDGSYNSCTIPTTHTHTDACYAYKCEGAHMHTDECIDCGIEVHSHNDACYGCGKEEHEHSDACCTSIQHTHTVSCWNNVGDKYNGTPGYYSGTPSQGEVYKRNNRQQRYIYIGDSWYYYNGTANSGTVVDPDCNGHIHGVDECNVGCGKEVHEHSDCAYTCGKSEHTHVSSCYNCDVEVHDHDDSCERIICGYAETHTHTNSCTDTIKIVHRKYQQSLKDIWPITDDNGVVYGDGERWDPSSSSYYDEVLVYIDNMPGDDFTLTLSSSSVNRFTMTYYLQVLPGEDYDKTYDGYNYKEYTTIKARYNYITKAEDFFDIEGFEQYASDPSFGTGNSIDPEDLLADFYYNRITDHELQFNNNGTVVKEISGIMYGAKIDDQNFVPDYPDNLEPNAYYFDGWYTSPGCFPGTEVNWDTITMPVGDLILYAKWSPEIHNVKFFDSLKTMQDYENKDPSASVFKEFDNVEHGAAVGSVVLPDPPKNLETEENLSFGGWFYIENGEKKAFTPTEFPIKRDMHIFADWKSDAKTTYRISYVLQEDKTTKVADDTIGFAYVGTTRTFNAKAGDYYNQLYDFSGQEINGKPGINYNKGYFPTSASHSITMQEEMDTDDPTKAENNVHTFYYVKANLIKYTVQYRDKNTGNPIPGLEDKVIYTENAVVTERFVAVLDHIPDAFYKRLVLSVEIDEAGKLITEKVIIDGIEQDVAISDKNVITFYYTPNTKSAYYAVHFMHEKLNPTQAEKDKGYATDGTGKYEETGTHIEGIGDVGGTVPITPQVFSGFSHEEGKGIAVIEEEEYVITSGDKDPIITYSGGAYNIKIDESGTELYIFYKRNEYPYEVHHYIYNTETLVDSVNAPSEKGMAIYGSELTREAKTISGYTCVSSPKKTIIIQEEDGSTVEHNRIIFYYSETQYTVEYATVPSEGGWLTKTLEVKKGTENFEGSVATANDNYKFIGWYRDEACTEPVTTEYGKVDPEAGSIVPNKDKLSATTKNIFYAKFELQAADFTIRKTNAADENQVFVYEVRSKTNENFVINVTIVGNGEATIKGLPLGDYTVTQLNKWSWRYSDPDLKDITDAVQEVTHAGNPDSEGNLQGTTVTFSDAEAKHQWLNGLSTLVKNIYGKLTVKQGGDADDE